MTVSELEKKDIEDRIDKLERGFTTLDKIIRGPYDSDQLQGLLYQVTMNSKFRKVVTAWLWLMTVSVTGIVIDRLFLLFGG